MIERSVKSIETKMCRPTNLDEVEVNKHYPPKVPTLGSTCDANLIKAEELNSLGEEPIKSSSSYSVSPYSISHEKSKASDDSPDTKLTGSSIFTFTKPINNITNACNPTTSSSTSDLGANIKSKKLSPEDQPAPTWSYAMTRSSSSQSPPTSASLIAADTTSSRTRHIHHLHHRPLHLHHYCSPPLQPITKDVTVKLPDNSNSNNIGVNSVLSSIPHALNTKKEIASYLTPTYSNPLQNVQLSSQTAEGLRFNRMSSVSSTDLSMASEDDKKINESISFIREHP